MTDDQKKPSPAEPIHEPFDAEPGDREVRVGIPRDGDVILTADAAEISAIRLLDAADKARSRR